MNYTTTHYAQYGLPLVLAGIVVALLAIPSFASAVITAQLDIGETGAEVTELQTFLAARPTLYPEGLVTGYFGTLTQAAVQRYQCEKAIICSGTPATTGYGRVGPETMTAINFEMTGQPGTGGPATGDVFAPIMSDPIVTVSATGTGTTTNRSVTIAWTTNEAARSGVMYGTAWPFLYSAAPSVADNSFGGAAVVTLTNLAPSTTYYFVRESVDASGNRMLDIANTFRTNP